MRVEWDGKLGGFTDSLGQIDTDISLNYIDNGLYYQHYSRADVPTYLWDITFMRDP